MTLNDQIKKVLPKACPVVKRLRPFCKSIELCKSTSSKPGHEPDIELYCIPKKVKMPATIQYSLFEPPQYSEKALPGLFKIIKGYRELRGANGTILRFQTPEGVHVNVLVDDTVRHNGIGVRRRKPRNNVKRLPVDTVNIPSQTAVECHQKIGRQLTAL